MKRISILLLAATSFAVPACNNDVTSGGDDQGPGTGSGSQTGDQWDQLLGQRVFDYPAALRIAALRLTGDLPTLSEINTVATPAAEADKKAAYEALVKAYLERPEFARQMLAFWRDTFKMGGSAMLETAPTFAARIAVENGSYMDLFTKSTANCPTYTAGTGFADAECTNGGPKAGVLTNPGAMSQFFSNFGFRRIRWIQETFDCLRFPAEVAAQTTDVGGASPYTGVWPFQSISSPTNGQGRVNFLDTSAVVCANCHSTINHRAPLFAYYDMTGAYQTQISVPTPLEGAPPATRTDYLPSDAEATAWKLGVPTADIPAFGAAMAADKEVAACGVARMWNWALGMTDIVDTLQDVPLATIQSQVDTFTASGFKMKDLIYTVFTSEDFTKF